MFQPYNLLSLSDCQPNMASPFNTKRARESSPDILNAGVLAERFAPESVNTLSTAASHALIAELATAFAGTTRCMPHYINSYHSRLKLAGVEMMPKTASYAPMKPGLVDLEECATGYINIEMSCQIGRLGAVRCDLVDMARHKRGGTGD